jgi:hypothetical protein
MPFSFDPEISREADQKIMSMLYFGKKRQKEIIEMSDLSDSRVRDHLEYLVDHHKVEREVKKSNGEVVEAYYELEDGRSKIVPPYPLADDDEIQNLLSTIIVNIKNIEDFYQNNEDIPPWDKRNKDEIGGFQTEHIDILHSNDELLSNASELQKLCGKRYHILSYEGNFKLFFEIIDKLVDNYLVLADQELYFNHPSKALDDIIMAANEIYVNYENSEENEMYPKKISERIPGLVGHIKSLPQHLGDSIMTLAFAINQEYGQEGFKNAIISNNWEMETLVLRAFEYYIRRNHTNILWEDLADIEKFENGKYEHTSKNIKNEIRIRYYQVADSDLSIDDKL